MSRNQRFVSILKLAEKKERDAAQVASAKRSRLLEIEDKLIELRSFRKEYIFSPNTSCTAGQLQQRQQFIQQLDEGIRVLNQAIQVQRESSDQSNQRWAEAYRYSNSLEKLVERYRSEERRKAEQREQDELDDRGQPWIPIKS